MPELNLGKVVGPQGPQGATGPAGAEGKQGPPGATGEAGKSAYQAAKDGGYTGTEAEFNAIMAIIDKHAARHKTGGADPLTAADVGATEAAKTVALKSMPATEIDFNNLPSEGGIWLTGIEAQNFPLDFQTRCALIRFYTGNDAYSLDLLGGYGNKDLAFRMGENGDWKKLATTDYVAQNAAPAGYGLGNVLAATMPGGDLNNAISNGWFIVSESSLNRPSAVKYGVLSVASRKNGETHQTLYGVGNTTDFIFDGTVLRRYLTHKGTWSAWEWENPPMQPGVEYRTTERWNSKPVYVKLINIGSLPAASGMTNRTKIGISISNLDKIVRLSGSVTDGTTTFPFPVATDDNLTIAFGAYVHAGIVYIESSKDYSSFSGAMKLWYTKTTE